MALERTGVDPFRAGMAGKEPAQLENRIRALGAGYMVRIGEGSTARDVTPSVSRLRYSARLPGGYADCSFVLSMWRHETRPWLRHGARVRVFFRGRLAWDGAVEELPVSTLRAEGIEVACLGHGASLRHRRWSKLFVEHGYGRWQAAAEVAAGNPPADSSGGLSMLMPGIAPGANEVGLWIVHGPDESFTTDSGKAAMLYTAPPGTEILRVKGTHEQNHINLMTHGIYAYQDSDGIPSFLMAGEETVFAVAGNATGASYDKTLTNPARWLSHFIVAFSDYGPAANDLRMGVYDHYVIGATDATGALFDTTDVTSYRALETLIAEYGGNVWMDTLTCPQSHPLAGSFWDTVPEVNTALDPQHAWDDLVFERATLEEAMQRLNAPVGWQWGVFEDGRLYWAPMETIMTMAPLSATGSAPPTAPWWWYQARESDGWELKLTRTTQGLVNAVQVEYTTTTGAPAVYELTDFTTPSPINDPDNALVPLQRRDAVVSIGEATEAIAQVVAEAYLQQYGRAAVQGTATVNAPALPRVQNGQRVNTGPGSDDGDWSWAPCIRPGEWVALNDVVEPAEVATVSGAGQLASTSGDYRFQTAGLTVPIRSVDVDADGGVVTLGLDSTRDTFGAIMARISRGAA